MNYLPLDVQFVTNPYSKENFLKALEIIDRNDPLNVNFYFNYFLL